MADPVQTTPKNPGESIQAAQQYASDWTKDAQQLLETLREFSRYNGLNEIQTPLDITARQLLQTGESNRAELLGDMKGFSAFEPAMEESFEAPSPFTPTQIAGVSGVSATAYLAVVNATQPVVPQAPKFTVPPLPQRPKIDSSVNLPAAPSIRLPAAPTNLAIPKIPAPPTITLPKFTAQSPQFTLAPPSTTFSFAEQAFESVLLDTVQSKLLADLINGGYGIDTTDEIRLWDRARAREVSSAAQAMDDARRNFTGRGFILPPGALGAALEAANTKLQQAGNELSREIAVKRADLFVQNRQFTIEQAKQLVTTLLNYHGSVMERMLNASKYFVDAAVATYNVAVAGFRAQLEKYQTDAQVFESLIRADLAKVEVYKAQIDAERMKVETNRTVIEQYRLEVDAIKTQVELYNSQVAAVRAVVELRQMELNVFKADIEVYAGSIQGQELGLKAYEAQIRGVAAQAEVYKNQVQASSLSLEAAKIQVESQRLQVQSQADIARANADNYRATIEYYKTKYEATRSVNAARVQAFEAAAQKAKALFEADAEALRADISLYSAEANHAVEVQRTRIANAQLSVDKLHKDVVQRQGATEYGVSFYNNVVSSALGAANALAASIENV